MGVVDFAVNSIEPYEGGVAFGATGPYELVQGVLRHSVDPKAPANAPIVDLDRAEVGPDGRVTVESDLVVLRPAAGAGNGGLLCFLANRGLVSSVPFSLGVAGILGAPGRIDSGDGMVLRRGYTVAWPGWQWDVTRRNGTVGLWPPEALDDDHVPIEGLVRVRFEVPATDRSGVDAPVRSNPLAGLAPAPGVVPPVVYPPVDPDDPDAVLTVCDRHDDDAEVIGRDRWRFARDHDGECIPDPAQVWLDTGFEHGRIYEVVYRTARCPVVGSGLLAVRDSVSFLRYGTEVEGNPVTGPIGFAIGTGRSQSGRFLREFLHAGLNLDDQGRPVFDGVLAHLAGGRRGEFNSRYGQPGVMWRGIGDVPPFDTAHLFAREGKSGDRPPGAQPKLVLTNSAAEYWRGDAAFSHIDVETARDLADPPGTRHYFFAGTDHVGDLGQLTATMLIGNAATGVSDIPLERAALVNLERWVVEGIEPPPSAVPRIADGTAVSREVVLARIATIPDALLPSSDSLPAPRVLDLGPDTAAGIARYPAAAGECYNVYVSSVDDDGNERAGVRLPQVAVPVAAYTGWNVRPPIFGLPDLIHAFVGSRLLFAATSRERTRLNDPRPAIDERYRDRADYEEQVQQIADELVVVRLLLVDDTSEVVQAALRTYDTAAAAS